MIKFFRKIRQNLSSEGNGGKYLKYAFGEIMLVVIGILIALSINNWNEERKTKKFELQFLSEIHTDLLSDINIHSVWVDQNQKIKESCEVLIEHLENYRPYNDSLNSYFSDAHIWYKMILKDNSYQKAKNHGLSFLNQDSISYLLTDIYELRIKWLNELDIRSQEYHQHTVLPVITELFDSSWGWDGEMKPYDYNELRSNRSYLNILNTTNKNWDMELRFQKELLESMKNLEFKLKLLLDE